MNSGSAGRPFWEPYLPAFLELQDVLRISSGFVLLPVEVDGPDIARELCRWMRRRGHPPVAFEPHTNDSWRTLAARLSDVDVDPNGFAIVIGSRRPLDFHEEGIRTVNFQRDRLAAHLRRPLLWAGPESFLNRTRALAPDFWSFATAVHRLEPSPPKSISRNPPAVLASLEREVDSARRKGDLMIWAELAVEYGRKLAMNGEHSRAVEVLTEVIDAVEQRLAEPDVESSLVPSLRPVFWDALLRRARSFRKLGDLVSAGTDIGVLLGQPRIPPATRARALLILGRIQEDAERWSEAERAHRRAWGVASEVSPRDGAAEIDAQARIGIGSALVAAGDPARQDEAYDMLREAMRMADELHKPELRAAALALLARGYAMARRDEEAVDAIDEARRIQLTIRSTTGLDVGSEIRAAEAALERDPPLAGRPPGGAPQHAGAPYDPAWYVRRPHEEAAIIAHLEHPGAAVALWGPLKIGKSTLIEHVLSELRSQDEDARRTSTIARLDMGEIRTICDLAPAKMRKSTFFDAVARRLAGAIGHAQLEASELDSSDPGDLLTNLLEDVILPRGGHRFMLVIDRTDETRGEAYHDDFLVLLRWWAAEARTNDVLSSLRIVLSFGTSPTFLSNDLHHSPIMNIALLQEVLDFGAEQIVSLANLYGILISDEDLRLLEHWIGGHPWMLRSLFHEARKGRSPLAELCGTEPLLNVLRPYVLEIRARLSRIAHRADRQNGHSNGSVYQVLREIAASNEGRVMSDGPIMDVYERVRPLGLLCRDKDTYIRFSRRIFQVAFVNGHLE